MLTNLASGSLTHVYTNIVTFHCYPAEGDVYVLQKVKKFYEPSELSPSFCLLNLWLYLFSLLYISLIFYQFTYLTFTVNYIYHMDKLEIKLEARTHVDLSSVYFLQDVHVVFKAKKTFMLQLLYIIISNDILK